MSARREQGNAGKVRSPICHKCGKTVSVDIGGFIGRGDTQGHPELLFVVFCPECGASINAFARERGGLELSPLSKTRSLRTRLPTSPKKLR